MKYKVKFLRVHEVEIEAENLDGARWHVNNSLRQHNPDTWKLLSIIPADYVEPSKETNLADALPKEAQAVLDRNEGFAAKVRRETAKWPGGIDDLELA